MEVSRAVQAHNVSDEGTYRTDGLPSDGAASVVLAETGMLDAHPPAGIGQNGASGGPVPASPLLNEEGAQSALLRANCGVAHLPLVEGVRNLTYPGVGEPGNLTPDDVSPPGTPDNYGATPAPSRSDTPNDGGEPSVMLGDHSIVSTGILDKLVCEMPIYEGTDPEFFRQMWHRIMLGQGHVLVDNNNVLVQSFITLGYAGGGGELPAAVNGPVFLTHPEPIPAADRGATTVSWSIGYSKGCLPVEVLDKFRNGGTVSERSFTSALYPKLACANINVVRQLSEYMDAGTQLFDNMGMYAKLLWAVGVRDLFALVDVVPEAVPFPIPGDPQFINLDEPNLNPMDIANAIEGSRIILVERFDYAVADLPIIYWLAKGGHRMNGPPGAATPHACYLNWPIINITILNHGPAGVAPAAAVLDSRAILTFLAKLASRRGEWDDFMRGLYWVADNLGMQFRPGVPGHLVMQPLFPMLSPRVPSPPMPADYNVMLRLIGITPSKGSEGKAEVEAFMRCNAAIRVEMLAVYTGALTAFATTAMHAQNLHTSVVVAWCTGVQLPRLATVVLQRNSISPEAGGQSSDPPMYRMIKSCFHHYMGIQVATRLYPNGDWLPEVGTFIHAAASYGGMADGQVPHLINALAIDNWITIRPLEWGVVGAGPKVDLSCEVKIEGADARQGWYAAKGSSTYVASAQAKDPFRLNVYGAQILNVIAQYYRMDAMAVNVQNIDWVPGSDAAVDPPIPWLGQDYDVASRSFRPCSIPSYSFTNAQVLAPALVGANLDPPMRHALRQWRGQSLQEAGIILGTGIAPQDADNNHDLFAGMAAFNLAGERPQAVNPT